MWRPEDEALLERLEDEEVLGRLLRFHAGVAAPRIHPRAAGLVASARADAEGARAVAAARDGDVAALARWLEGATGRGRAPELLHHLALYFGEVAVTLETVDPEAAANAWTRALAAWLALADEGRYLERLEEAVLGDAPRARAAAWIPPARVPLEAIADLARRADAAARSLSPPGRAALLALARVADAARIAGAAPALARGAVAEAERRRNLAIDAALAALEEALADAQSRGALASSGRDILARALDVWAWAGHDEAVERFTVDQLTTLGWELYRARSWDALRHALEPFRPLVESLAARVQRDPASLAYAAPTAQMFVFLSDVEPVFERRLALAERAVALCPTHRNGRLVLAALLCEQARAAMRAMVLFARRDEIERVEALLARAEKLYPQSSELPDVKATLDRIKRGRIAL